MFLNEIQKITVTFLYKINLRGLFGLLYLFSNATYKIINYTKRCSTIYVFSFRMLWITFF